MVVWSFLWGLHDARKVGVSVLQLTDGQGKNYRLYQFFVWKVTPNENEYFSLFFIFLIYVFIVVLC